MSCADVREVVVLVLTGVMDHGSASRRRALAMGRIAKLEQQARTKARQRRIAMDYDRATRDMRVEATAAEAILALGEREDAVRQVRSAEVRAGDALQRIIAEDVKVGGVAQLCDLSVGEVQRLRRAAQEAKDSRGHFGPSDPNPVGSPDVTLRPLGHAPVRHCGSEETHRLHEQPVDAPRAR